MLLEAGPILMPFFGIKYGAASWAQTQPHIIAHTRKTSGFGHHVSNSRGQIQCRFSDRKSVPHWSAIHVHLL